MEKIRIATRKSPLALWQAEDVKRRLEELHPALSVELVTMTTRGDVLLDSPLAKIGGKGLFVKELEVAMLDGRADIAVHSVKDVPATLPDGLHVATILLRENPHDAFVSNSHADIDALPAGARVGTCSLRRQSQLLERRPDLEILPLRGNVNTRLAKLDAGEYDAIILAAAGLIRLEMHDRIRAEIPTDVSLPAAGQGIVGIETRVGDAAVAECLAGLHHGETAIRVAAERAVSARLDGGCQVPIGAYSELRDGEITLRGLVASPDGKTLVRETIVAEARSAEAAHALGVTLAERLLASGADRILADLGLSPAPVDSMSTVFRPGDGGADEGAPDERQADLRRSAERTADRRSPVTTTDAG